MRIGIGALASLVAVLMGNSSFADTVQPYSIYGSYNDASYQSCEIGCPATSDHLDISLPGSYSTVVGASSVTTSIALQPAPTLSVSASTDGISFAQGVVNLDYYIKLVGPGTDPVSVGITAAGSVFGTNVYSGSFRLAVDAQDLLWQNLNSSNPGSFSVDTSISLAVNTDIFVHLYLLGQAGNDPFYGSSSVLASLDPVFHAPEGYTVIVSEGVGNSAVPLPAALPLFTSGLGMLGLLGWRRKRTAQASV